MRGKPSTPRKKRPKDQDHVDRNTPEKLAATSERMRIRWRDHREEMLKRVGRPMYALDGFTNEQSQRRLARAKKYAEKVIEKMEEEGLLPEVPEDALLENDQAVAKEALKEAVVIMRMKGAAATRLQAARLILDFTRARPASNSNIAISTAESFLAGLIDK